MTNIINSSSTAKKSRIEVLRAIAIGLILVLVIKMLIAIVWQYRFYFPPDFRADFLLGRQKTFRGLYRIAFYTHIIAGPLAIVSGVLLMVSGIRGWYMAGHRWLGRVLMVLVLGVIMPSGLVMASEAFTGPVAGLGFASLSIATGLTAAMALVHARSRNFRLHRRWATRCFVLLCSPLLLRLISGGLSALQAESNLYYQINAWLSWLVPLAILESGGGARIFCNIPSAQVEEA